MLMFWKVRQPTKSFHCLCKNISSTKTKFDNMTLTIFAIVAFIALVGWANLVKHRPTNQTRHQKFHGTDWDWHDIVNDL